MVLQAMDTLRERNLLSSCGLRIEPLETMGLTDIDCAFWRGRRVLLTGHTGFKGSWLALWLQQLGAEVFGLSLEPESVELPADPLFTALGLADRLGARHCIGDIRHPETVQATVNAAQPEVVLHLAAQPLVRQSYADPVGTWSTNVQGTLQLLRPCVRSSTVAQLF